MCRCALKARKVAVATAGTGEEALEAAESLIKPGEGFLTSPTIAIAKTGEIMVKCVWCKERGQGPGTSH